MDVELSRAEAELQSEEANLHTELRRLVTVGIELSGRLGALTQRATAAGDAAMAKRAKVNPPKVDADEPFAQALAARETALKARRDANATARQRLTAAKAELQKLAQQVIADEKALEAMEAKAKEVPAPTPPAPPMDVPPRMVPRADAVMAAAPAAKKPQRRSSRVKMQAAVDFTSDNNFFNGFSANISDGGLFIATVDVVALGTEVDLGFTLPSGARIEAKGIVRWVREVNDKLPDSFPGIGIQFTALKPEAQSAIDDFLAQRDPLFFAAD